MCFSFSVYMHDMRRLGVFSADCLAEEDGKMRLDGNSIAMTRIKLAQYIN